MKIDTFELIKIIITLICVISSVIAWIVAVKKDKKKKKESGETIDPGEYAMDLVYRILNSMETSEKLYSDLVPKGKKTGAYKLKDVLNEVRAYCMDNGMPYNEDDIKGIISRLVDFSHVVNADRGNQIIEKVNNPFIQPNNGSKYRQGENNDERN